jgi:SAM-dependent methyltransferase
MENCVPSKPTLDSSETTTEHGRLIAQKHFLNQIYRETYQFFVENMQVGGKSLELGSGAGFLKEFVPDLTTSDVVELAGVDEVIFAESLPYGDASLANIFMFNVLHHIQDNEAFLGEAIRTLKDGGKIVMVEPGSTPFSRLIYTYLHHEPCIPDQKEWKLPEGGRLSMANAMLPWIIFKRDRDILTHKFPDLKVTVYENFMPFKYLLSGGVSKPQLLPDCLYSSYSRFENMLSPLNNLLGMFVRIVVERQPRGAGVKEHHG